MRAPGKNLSAGRVLVLLGGIIGFLLIIYGVWRIASSHRPDVARQAPAAKVTQVVTAAKPLVRGQLIQTGDLTSTAVSGVVPAGALTLPAQADGKIAIADIQPHQLILDSLVSADASAAGLAMLVPVGQRVFSIDVTDDIAVGGFIRPGDIVDIEIVLPSEVIAGGQATGGDRSESRALLQSIRVLTVGPTFGQAAGKGADGKDASSRALTLAMNPDQVGPFMLARKLGHFYLLLRNPNDHGVVPDGRASLASVRGGFSRVRTSPVSARPSRVPSAQAIELIVGGRRQIIYPEASSHR